MGPKKFIISVGIAFTLVIRRFLVDETPTIGHKLGYKKYGAVLVQWYVVHSLERCLAGSMIYNDEFN
jgi:hypothetical protein